MGVTTAASIEKVDDERLVAVDSWVHTWGLVGIFSALALAGAMLSLHGSSPGRVSKPTLYLSIMAMQYGLLRYVQRGAAQRGASLRLLIGGAWSNASSVLRDLAWAAVLYGLWTAMQLGWQQFSRNADAKLMHSILPFTMLEQSLWVMTSMSAAFVEEIAFRGYFQRQFGALTGSLWLGVLLQALVFGIAHLYQGMDAAAKIVLFGLLFGAFAMWRRSLRAGMLAHALADILAGLAGVQR